MSLDTYYDLYYRALRKIADLEEQQEKDCACLTEYEAKFKALERDQAEQARYNASASLIQWIRIIDEKSRLFLVSGRNASKILKDRSESLAGKLGAANKVQERANGEWYTSLVALYEYHNEINLEQAIQRWCDMWQARRRNSREALRIVLSEYADRHTEFERCAWKYFAAILEKTQPEKE